MNRRYYFIFTILVALVLTSCIGAPPSSQPNLPERWMKIDELSGKVEISENGSDAWREVAQGQTIPPKSSLRTSTDAFVIVSTNDDSSFELGKDTLLAIEQFSETLEKPDILLNLQEGGVMFAASQHTLEKGSFGVRTMKITSSLVLARKSGKPGGLAVAAEWSHTGVLPSGYVGSMIVRIEKGKTPQEAATLVGVVEGNGTITFPGGDSFTGQMDEFVSIDHDTLELEVIPGSVVEEMKKMGIVDLRSYFFRTLTPESTSKPTITPITPTSAATWTPFPTFDQPTITPTYNPLPTHRVETPSTVLNSEGLTEAEAANSGTHRYAGSGIAYGDCVFSGSEAEKIGSLTFTSSGVTIASEDGSGSITYGKMAANVYQTISKDKSMTATITFFGDGWDLEVLKDGQPCSHQTFLLN